MREEPRLAEALPPIFEVPQEHRADLAKLRALGLERLPDIEALRAFVRTLEPSLAWPIVHGLGNARDREPFVQIAADALSTDAPDLRVAALYLFAQWVREGGDASVHASGLAAACCDERRSEAHKKKVSAEALSVLRAARLGSVHPEAFDHAVAAIESPAQRKRAARSLAAAPPPPKTVSAAVRMLDGTDREAQKQALDALARMLEVELQDIRSAHPALVLLLRSDDADLRRRAAMLAATVCDNAGSTEEAARLEAPLRAAADDDDALREHVAYALRCLERWRQAPSS